MTEVPAVSVNRAAARLLLCMAAGLSCVSGPSGGTDGTEYASIPAGKATWVSVPALAPVTSDSLAPGSIMSLPTGPVLLRAFFTQGEGATPSSRATSLAASGYPDATVVTGSSRSSQNLSFVAFTSGDTCRIERIWPRGAGEALVLSVEGRSGTPQALLTSTERLLERATPVEWPGLRTTRLSDRSRIEIQEDLDQHDSDRLPTVVHRMGIELVPTEHAFEIDDTLEVDFSGTEVDGMRFAMPRIDGSAPDDIVAITGSYTRESDSVFFAPDPSTGAFLGIYHSRFENFYREERGFVQGRVRLSSSFSCGIWFYPGCDIPSDYELTARVPLGGSFFCPLIPAGHHSEGSEGVASFVSPPGGLPGPLSWAAGNLEAIPVASDRSRLIHAPLEAATRDSAASRASALAGTLWNRFGFEGARLDIVLVESIDRPVLAAGPGFLLVSPSQLALLDGSAEWDDSLMAGLRPSGPALVARASRAFLGMSSHLPGYLSSALSAWAVYLFVSDHCDAGDAENILECFRRYYLAETAGNTDEEPAIGDSRLAGSSLEEPVLLGKAPIVFTMFSRIVPGFDEGLRSALGRLRHPGVALLSISSALGTPFDPSLDSLYWNWMTMPGVPQILVTWRESSGRVDFTVEQLQPGREFPLPLGAIEYIYEDGDTAEGWIYGPTPDGGFWSLHNPTHGRLLAIDVSPSRIIPADLVYSHER